MQSKIFNIFKNFKVWLCIWWHLDRCDHEIFEISRQSIMKLIIASGFFY